MWDLKLGFWRTRTHAPHVTPLEIWSYKSGWLGLFGHTHSSYFLLQFFINHGPWNFHFLWCYSNLLSPFVTYILCNIYCNKSIQTHMLNWWQQQLKHYWWYLCFIHPFIFSVNYVNLQLLFSQPLWLIGRTKEAKVYMILISSFNTKQKYIWSCVIRFIHRYEGLTVFLFTDLRSSGLLIPILTPPTIPDHPNSNRSHRCQ